MDKVLPYLLLAVVSLALGLIVGRLSRRLRSKRGQLAAFEDEERRMFEFLHNLGEAISSETSQSTLYRIIVQGLEEVVGAGGGALYLLDEAGDYLEPKFLSEGCPPLVGVPIKVWNEAEKDPRAMESYLRLARIGVGQGILGECLASGEPQQYADLRSHESFRDALHGFFKRDVEAMVAPLRHGGKDLGVLAVARADGEPFTPNDFTVFRSAAEQSAFALGNALIYREAEERRQFESDLRNAGEVQRVLLPQEDPVIPGYRIAGTNLPARLISGDYYDYLDLGDGHHGVVIADVSGKGVAAGLLMAMCRSMLRSTAAAVRREDPRAVLAEVNRQLFPDIREDMFISLFYAIVEADSNEVRVARAGHDAALLFRRGDRRIEEVKPPGLALGIDAGEVFERVTRVETLYLEPGDCLLFHTDGVREAVNPAGEEFGSERLREAFFAGAPLGAEAVLEIVQRDLAAFTDVERQMDDITLVALERRMSAGS